MKVCLFQIEFKPIKIYREVVPNELKKKFQQNIFYTKNFCF